MYSGDLGLGYLGAGENLPPAYQGPVPNISGSFSTPASQGPSGTIVQSGAYLTFSYGRSAPTTVGVFTSPNTIAGTSSMGAQTATLQGNRLVWSHGVTMTLSSVIPAIMPTPTYLPPPPPTPVPAILPQPTSAQYFFSAPTPAGSPAPPPTIIPSGPSLPTPQGPAPFVPREVQGLPFTAETEGEVLAIKASTGAAISPWFWYALIGGGIYFFAFSKKRKGRAKRG